MSTHRSGLTAAVGAYLLWGLFPLYWPLLEPAGAIEILAHRITWSLVFLALLLAATTGFRYLRDLTRRQYALLTLAAVLITVNWGAFIYGVTSERVVETSLGYFLTPLVTVALGATVLHEQLRPAQLAAIVLGALAVVVLAIDYGHVPWIALTLAATFGSYGLVKKRADVGGTRSMAIETGMLAPLALLTIAVLAARGDATFGTEGTGHAALMALGGVVTAVPLILFGAATIRIPLVTVGILQYIAPVMQFLIGVLVYAEEMTAPRFAGFALVWLGLVIFSVDALRASRRVPVQVPAPIS